MAWRTRSARPSSGTSDSPSARAARATASATAADTSRRLVTGGSTAAPGRGGVGQAGQRVGRRGQHAVADPAGPADGDPEPEAGKDQRVVGLGHLVLDSVVVHRRERAAGRDQRPPAGPGDQVSGLGLGVRGRVGQRHDDRPVNVGCHLGDDRLGEGAGLRRGPDQHRGPAVRHYLGQADAAVLVALPAGHLVGLACVRDLEVPQLARIVAGQQALAAEARRTARWLRPRLRPSSIMTCRSASAIPTPAVPAPWITTV